MCRVGRNPRKRFQGLHVSSSGMPLSTMKAIILDKIITNDSQKSEEQTLTPHCSVAQQDFDGPPVLQVAITTIGRMFTSELVASNCSGMQSVPSWQASQEETRGAPLKPFSDGIAHKKSTMIAVHSTALHFQKAFLAPPTCISPRTPHRRVDRNLT